jgi:hypothetical protein
MSLATLAGVMLFSASFAIGQEVQHLSITQAGGMPGMPIITGLSKTTNGLEVKWDGPSGYYQLFRKWGLAGNWEPVGGANLNRKATITEIHSNAFFRVAGPEPQYAGAQACIECHANIHTSEMDTRHSHALETLKTIGQHNNPACLPCHTVGNGLNSGFISEAATPHLAGVQCESCHGPAANHAANEFDLTVRPRVEIAATVCGGCHTGKHQPTFEEWSGSGHSAVVEDMNPAGRINACGRCHSGSSRLALLKNEPLPAGDANMGVVCITCHDPHGNHVFTNVLSGLVTTNQLRNPVASTNDFFLTTAEAFTNKYNENINICAQCHNHRGATWTSSSRPPHHSPQYNMMLSTIGELPAGSARYPISTHGRLEKQCVTCHMQTEEYESAEHPAVTGHSFKVETYNACISCHNFPGLLTQFAQGSVSNKVQQTKSYLDLWATTKAPQALQTKYGVRAWEFTTAGELSGGVGPNATEQALIPENIRKARFNLYIVLYDGSYGVHNPHYAVGLLEASQNWIQQELEK